jgi:beta-galactosidase
MNTLRRQVHRHHSSARGWFGRGLLVFLGIVLLLVPAARAQQRAVSQPCGGRELTPLDTGWRFHLGDAPGSEQPSAMDPDGWQTVSLPHDWAVQGPRKPDYPSGGPGSFAPMGVGWYRLHLVLPAWPCAHPAGRTFVQFDGIMANSDVWLNGHLLGHHPYGYTSLNYDLTPFLQATPGADNLLAVRADNSLQPSSRFYQGAGIFRHVRLVQTPDVHFAAWGTAIRTPRITASSADILVTAEVRNDAEHASRYAVRVTLFDSAGKEAGHAVSSPQTIAPASVASYSVSLTLAHPHLWNLDDPAMYRAQVQTVAKGRSADSEQIPFGVREMHFDADKGFFLNGIATKIKGVALHSDIGALGMAAPVSLWEHRLRAMRHMGANAVRTAHNPVAPEFLDLCDRMGFLVLDEFFDVWTVGKNPYDYHLYFRQWFLTDTRDSVRRDRNHPSIFAWSAGNEIHDTPHPEIARPILASLIDEYHKDDPTRPVTQALFRPNASHDYQDGLADMLDVIGQNYRPAELLAAHDEKPSRRILGTENTHDRATWLAVRDHPAYSGIFLWSGTDYLGESRHWPLIAGVTGMNDRTDYPRPDSLERESWWMTTPVVHIVRRTAPVQKAPTDPGYELQQYMPKQTAFPDWTPLNQQPHPEEVEVYSNCPEVSLSLNAQSLGSKPLPTDASARVWQVTYAPGSIEATCTGGAAKETLTTAGAPAALRLTAEIAPAGKAFDDVSLVRLTVVDAHGIAVPGAAVPVIFSVSGAGVLLATDDANPVYSMPFQSPSRTTLDGRAVAYLRRSGSAPVTLRAESPGLPEASISF